MKKILNLFFTTLGVIFFVIILIGVYVFIADPYNLKPLFLSSDSDTVSESTSAETTDKHPLLNTDQEKALETFGIDPAAVPSEISPEQEACFERAIGSERVVEIKAGDSPSATEIFKARECI